jgi:hypothetical protein
VIPGCEHADACCGVEPEHLCGLCQLLPAERLYAERWKDTVPLVARVVMAKRRSA